jgi:hypothetical protein
MDKKSCYGRLDPYCSLHAEVRGDNFMRYTFINSTQTATMASTSLVVSIIGNKFLHGL